MEGNYLGSDLNGSAPREVSLLSKEVRVCPFETYRKLRLDEPVKFLADQNIWILTRYRDVRYVLQNPHRFSARESPSITNPYKHSPKALNILSNTKSKPRAKTLILADPPEHTRYRTAALLAIDAARMLREFAPKISTIVDDLIDKFCEVGHCEFISAF